jgi:hypothetical protein
LPAQLVAARVVIRLDGIGLAPVGDERRFIGIGHAAVKPAVAEGGGNN